MVRDMAHHLGRLLAEQGHVLYSAEDYGEVMEAACCGAREAGGLAVGIYDN